MNEIETQTKEILGIDSLRQLYDSSRKSPKTQEIRCNQVAHSDGNFMG